MRMISRFKGNEMMIEKLIERKNKLEKELMILHMNEKESHELEVKIRQIRAELNNILFQLSGVNKVNVVGFCFG